MADDKIRCDACPVLCYIKPGMTGACDRYANQDGELVRVDPHVLLDRTMAHGGEVVPFLEPSRSGPFVHPPPGRRLDEQLRQAVPEDLIGKKRAPLGGRSRGAFDEAFNGTAAGALPAA